ncbi:MAG: type II toxin-antitoxin system HicB family antitoxin [Bryobacteraceae bacterium]
MGLTASNVGVVIRRDEDEDSAWYPELEGCRPQAATLVEVMADILETMALYQLTLPESERDGLLSREIVATAAEVNAQGATVVRNGSGSGIEKRGFSPAPIERETSALSQNGARCCRVVPL